MLEGEEVVDGCSFTRGTHGHHMSPDLPLISLNGPPHNEAYTQHQSDEEPRVRLVSIHSLFSGILGVKHQSRDMEEGRLVHRPTSRYSWVRSGPGGGGGGGAGGAIAPPHNWP